MLTYAERLAWARRMGATLYAHGARRVFMFGSLGRGGVQDIRSDIDLAVEGVSQERAAELIVAPPRCRVDVVVLETAEPELRASCLRGAVLLPRDGAEPPRPGVPVTERRPYLYVERLRTVVELLNDRDARRIADLGCGEGRLVTMLASEGADHVLGVDRDRRALRMASRLTRRLPPAVRHRITLTLGLVTWRDPTLLGHDAITAVEVIEHMEPAQLNAFQNVVFGFARPRTVILTTPNAEYNRLFGMAPHRHRIPDHRFEWTREQFGDWSEKLAARHGYTFHPIPIGPTAKGIGSPTQLGLFTRGDGAVLRR